MHVHVGLIEAHSQVKELVLGQVQLEHGCLKGFVGVVDAVLLGAVAEEVQQLREEGRKLPCSMHGGA